MNGLEKKNYNVGFLLLIMLFFYTVMSFLIGSYSVYCFLLLLVMLGFICMFFLDRNYINMFFLIFTINVVFSFLLYYYYIDVYGVPYYRGGSDDLFYEQDAQAVINSNLICRYSDIRGYVVSQFHNSVGYVYIVAVINYLSSFIDGYHTLLPRILNGFLLALISILSAKISKEQLNLSIKTSKVVGYFIGVSPLMLFNSAHVFRDILVSLALLITFYMWSNLQKFRIYQVLLAIVATCLLYKITSELRSTANIILIVIVIINIYKFLFGLIKSKAIKLLMYCFGIFSILFIVNFFDLITLFSSYTARYTDYRLEISDGLSQIVFNTPFPLGIILRMGYLAITPFPTFDGGFDKIFPSLNGLLQIGLLPIIIIGIHSIIKSRKGIHIVLTAAVIYFIVSITTFSDRHILMFYPYMAMIFGYGWEMKKHYKKKVLVLYFIVYFLMLILFSSYMFLKLI